MLSLWAACGLLPWCVALVAGRGRGAFSALPLAIGAGMMGGLVVAVVADSWLGVLVSLVAAVATGTFAATAMLARAATQEGRS